MCRKCVQNSLTLFDERDKQRVGKLEYENRELSKKIERLAREIGSLKASLAERSGFEGSQLAGRKLREQPQGNSATSFGEFSQ